MWKKIIETRGFPECFFCGVLFMGLFETALIAGLGHGMILTLGVWAALAVGLFAAMITYLAQERETNFFVCTGSGILGSYLVVVTISSIKYFPNHIGGLILIIFCVLFAEIIFFKDDRKPKRDDNPFWFTAKRKAIALAISVFVIFGLHGVIQLFVHGIPYIKKHFPVVLVWLGYIGSGFIFLIAVLLILYGYIKLNSLKYKR